MAFGAADLGHRHHQRLFAEVKEATLKELLEVFEPSHVFEDKFLLQGRRVLRAEPGELANGMRERGVHR